MSHDDFAHLSTAHRRPDRPPGPDAQLRRRRPLAQRLAAPGRRSSRRCRPTPAALPVGRDDALDGRPPGRARRQGARPARRLARQGVRPVPRSRATPTPPASGSPASASPRASSPSGCATAARLLGATGDAPRPRRRRPRAWDGFQARALDALASAEARGAFRIDREDPQLRDRYGRHIHGQCLLLARRLVEAGVGLVTVNWHDDGQNFWDTHGDNFNRLKDDLMPPADQGFAALLDDLDARGLLDETLVVWVGEFGRTPQITAGQRRPRALAALLLGRPGRRRRRGGQVYGARDRWAAYPARDPVSPDDLGATILHALGIDPATEIRDPLGRPLGSTTARPLLPLFA